MTSGQAALLVLAFAAAVSLLLAVGVAVMFVRYEIEDRLRKRRRRGLVVIEQPPATIHPIAWARNNRDRRPAA